MKQGGEYAVAYDVSDDRERAKVEKVLKGFGFRVQKSVFECRLTRGDRRSLIEQLERLALRTGSIKIYRIYGGTQAIVIGKPMEDPDSEFAYVI